MRLFIIAIITTLGLSCSNPYKDTINTPKDYQIIPQPISIKMANGRFLINDNTKIAYAPDLQNEAKYLAEFLGTLSGKTVSVVSDDKKTEGNIVLELDDSIDDPEGYELSVAYDKILMTGKNC